MVLDKVKIAEVFNESTKQYQVGFPSYVIIDENEEDRPLPTYKTPLYDHETKGSVCFLDQEWVKKCEKEYILQLKQQLNRTHPIPDYVEHSILSEMQRLCSLHHTHVYKYNCKMTLKQKFGDALLEKKNKGTTSSFQYMKGDIITKKQLYDTVVVLHGCQKWYDDVMDKKVTNKVFELPVEPRKPIIFCN